MSGPAHTLRRLGIALASVLLAAAVWAEQWQAQQLLVTPSWLTQAPSVRWLWMLLPLLVVGGLAIAYAATRLPAVRLASAWRAAGLGLALLLGSALGLSWMWMQRPSAQGYLSATLSDAQQPTPSAPAELLACQPTDFVPHSAIDYPVRSGAADELLVRKLCHGQSCDLRLASTMRGPHESHCWASGPVFERSDPLRVGEDAASGALLVSDGRSSVAFCPDRSEPNTLLHGNLGGRTAPSWFMLLLSGLALVVASAELAAIMRCRRRDQALRAAAQGWSDAGGWLHVPQLQRLLHLPELAYVGPALLLSADRVSSVYRGGRDPAQVVCGDRDTLLQRLQSNTGQHVLSALVWSLCGVLAGAPYWLRMLLASPC